MAELAAQMRFAYSRWLPLNSQPGVKMATVALIEA